MATTTTVPPAPATSTVTPAASGIALTKHLKKSYGTLYFAKDMKKSIAWYKEMLGLTAAIEDEGWTEFPLSNGHSICLHPIDHENRDKKAALSGYIILQVSNIREVADDLKKRNAHMDEVKEVCPGAYAVNVYDPDGNIVSLYEAPEYPAA